VLHAARTTPDRQVARAKAEGWTYDGSQATEWEVLELIHGLIRVVKPSIVVETGTFSGMGAQAIAAALARNQAGHLWTIEINDNEYPPTERVTFVRGDSVEWSKDGCPDSIDMAWVDCGPPDVRIEVFGNLLAKMKPGGLILCHDLWFYEESFYEALCAAAGKPAALRFPALNGVGIWEA
jgi:predicted O-methyltransferase YrrM